MGIIALLLSLIIWGFLFYVLWWGKGQIALGDPWDKGITLILVIAAVVVLFGLMLGRIAPFPFLLGLV